MYQLQKRLYNNVLANVGKHVRDAQYAVRGAIPIRGQEITMDLRTCDPEKYPFKETAFLNIGNPQQCGQGSLTFNREVLAGLVMPKLMDTDMISEDAKARIYFYQTHQQSPVGAYTTNSKGWTYAREAVANFIQRRDGCKADPEHVYCTNGASEGARTALMALIRNSNDGILCPIPQYPLYSALLTLYRGALIPYYLAEERNWGLNAEHLEQQIVEAKAQGICPRGIVVINPGNPTGQVMKYQDLADIIKICHEHSIVIIADEVYQTNIYKPGSKFISMRKVLHELGKPYSDTVELISLNSISKGMLGECGFRGGYFETHNLTKEAEELMFKLKSMDLCGNTIGQTSVELMVNPPTLGVESADCVHQYEREYFAIHLAYREKAKLLEESFNTMTNVSCTEIEGAMYGFPKIEFSQKFIDEARDQGKEPDFLYCMDMVNQTGIMTIPGSGFKQYPGTYHFRITNLVTPYEKMEQVMENLIKFNEEWHAKH